MTNTVARTPLKRGTSARLGLRLPKPRVRIRELIVGPASLWVRLDETMRRECVDTTARLFDATFPPDPVPITVVNVTATRGGEPVHVSEVVAELMKTLKPKGLLRPWPGEFLMHDMVDCCDVVHTWSADADSWLPGCTHYGAV